MLLKGNKNVLKNASNKHQVLSHCHNGGGRYAGIHLSGANAHKTSLVVLENAAGEFPLTIRKVYEKIGSLAGLFSDERIVDILVHEMDLRQIFVDCPLSVPPCVACRRDVCPGNTHCDDLSVAWMLALEAKIPRKGARKHRPINTQSQRLWDVFNMFDADGDFKTKREEPSYSANLAPLVSRAQALCRRLRGAQIDVQVNETSIASTMSVVAAALGVKESVCTQYRRFENGRAHRMLILKALEEQHWINFDEWDTDDGDLSDVGNFSALISAWVGALYHKGLTNSRPDNFADNEGWVITPQLCGTLDFTPAKVTN